MSAEYSKKNNQKHVKCELLVNYKQISRENSKELFKIWENTVVTTILAPHI